MDDFEYCALPTLTCTKPHWLDKLDDDDIGPVLTSTGTPVADLSEADDSTVTVDALDAALSEAGGRDDRDLGTVEDPDADLSEVGGRDGATDVDLSEAGGRCLPI